MVVGLIATTPGPATSALPIGANERVHAGAIDQPEPRTSSIDIPEYIRFLQGEAILPTRITADRVLCHIHDSQFRSSRDLPLTGRCHPPRATSGSSKPSPPLPMESGFDLHRALRTSAVLGDTSMTDALHDFRVRLRNQAIADAISIDSGAVWRDTDGDGIMEGEVPNLKLGTGSGHRHQTSSGRPNYPGLGTRPRCVRPRSGAIVEQLDH